MSNKEHIKKVANDLKLEPTDEVLTTLDNEWNTIIKSLEIINLFDTKNVKPMIYPNEEPITFLRNDTISINNFNSSTVIKNAKKSKENFIVIKRVVSDD